MIKSGRSIALAKGYLESLGADVLTVSLYILTESTFKPDVVVQELTEIIALPWD